MYSLLDKVTNILNSNGLTFDDIKFISVDVFDRKIDDFNFRVKSMEISIDNFKHVAMHTKFESDDYGLSQPTFAMEIYGLDICGDCWWITAEDAADDYCDDNEYTLVFHKMPEKPSESTIISHF